MTLTLFCLFGAFIGFGLGRGQKLSEQLEKGELKANHQITFSDDAILKVNLIGHNSDYLFYAAEKDTTVSVVPIRGNIKKIVKIAK